MNDPSLPQDGRSFGVDLYAMRWAGTERMPFIANHLLTANNAVADTAGPDVTAFTRTHGTSQVAESWMTLRDTLQDILGHNGERIQTVGETLAMCADAYEDQDTDNKDSLNSAASGLPEIQDPTDDNGTEGIPSPQYSEEAS